MKLKKVLIKTKISSLAPIEAVSFLLLLEQEKDIAESGTIGLFENESSAVYFLNDQFNVGYRIEYKCLRLICR